MRKLGRIIFFGGAVLTWLFLGLWLLLGDKLAGTVEERRAELVGGIADRYIASQSAPADPNATVKTVAGLHHIEVAAEQVRGPIYRATGVGNSYLVKTSAGNVLFDAGLATQAARQKRLLQEVAPGELRYIILSHSHADHMGATKFWLREYPNAQIVAHREFAEGQRYLDELQAFFWNRNRLLYTFMPEEPAEPDSLFAYGGIEPDILVDERSEFRFELGGQEFVVLSAPGAEGDDNIVLWLPGEAALFSGDEFGPLFPMVPNLFTLRGEKFRDPTKYIHSLEKLIALQPAIILPSHFDPIEGQQQLQADLTRMRDATRYIHDETIAGMNAGKSLWQLMEDIQLPAGLALSQGHGKVSWNVRSIWEHYSTWFKFESTTELYPQQLRSFYPQLAELVGTEQDLVAAAQAQLQQAQPVTALHLVEITLAGFPDSKAALEVRLQALEELVRRCLATTGNFSELGWLNSRISATKAALADTGPA